MKRQEKIIQILDMVNVGKFIIVEYVIKNCVDIDIIYAEVVQLKKD